ncbi:MAG TPA: thioesterase family protein [Burkholderiaceae bacterium]|nr:thioesterase family protein [Burkholderiaceae bacterium]
MTPYEKYRLRIPLRVRWAEVDLQGVVFNGNYLTYCDVCVTEYWRAIGMPYPAAFLEIGSDMFVRKATLEYHAAAVFDDELEVCGRTGRLGRTSLVFQVGMFRRGSTDSALIEGELVYVNVDPSTRATRPLPEALRQRIREFEPRSPEGERAHDAS